MWQEIVRIFSVKRREYTSQRGADARECAANQLIKWSDLLLTVANSSLSAVIRHNIGQDCIKMRDFIARNAAKLFTISRTGSGGWIVSGVIPILPDDFSASDGISRYGDMLVAALIIELAPALMIQEIRGPIEQSLPFGGNTPYFAFGAVYAAEKVSDSNLGIEKLQKTALEGETLFKEFKGEFQSIRAAAGENFEAGRRYVSELDQKSSAFMEKLQSDADAKIDARLNAKEELDNIKEPVDLWSKAAARHRKRFQWGLGGLLAAVTAAAYAAIELLSPALNNLGFVKADTAQPFTPASTFTLATMAALIAAAGFVLKIAGRFVTNALTLAEDAEVRAALADTFIGLTAKNTNATSEDRDKARTVMLAALFRPLPGHQQEDITAPTVLSLVQDMLKKPGS